MIGEALYGDDWTSNRTLPHYPFFKSTDQNTRKSTYFHRRIYCNSGTHRLTRRKVNLKSGTRGDAKRLASMSRNCRKIIINAIASGWLTGRLDVTDGPTIVFDKSLGHLMTSQYLSAFGPSYLRLTDQGQSRYCLLTFDRKQIEALIARTSKLPRAGPTRYPTADEKGRCHDLVDEIRTQAEDDHGDKFDCWPLINQDDWVDLFRLTIERAQSLPGAPQAKPARVSDVQLRALVTELVDSRLLTKNGRPPAARREAGKIIVDEMTRRYADAGTD